jgi:putative redox protein
MNGVVRHTGGLGFIGKGDTNHWVVMDGPPELRGENAGSRPKELVLLALGGCTGADVASLLTKMRVPFRKFEIAFAAETATEHPQVFTRIDLTYKLEGDGLAVSSIERAIRLSQDKYCPVSAMLRPTVPIHWTVEVNGLRVLSSESLGVPLPGV